MSYRVVRKPRIRFQPSSRVPDGDSCITACLYHGFDDIGLATAVYSSLTIVRVPQKEMGRSAAKLLLDLLFKEGTAGSFEFETELAHREFLAPTFHG